MIFIVVFGYRVKGCVMTFSFFFWAGRGNKWRGKGGKDMRDERRTGGEEWGGKSSGKAYIVFFGGWYDWEVEDGRDG